MAIHLGRPLPDASCNQPGWQGLETGPANARHPYSVLLPVGFALPPPLPETRCALTAPFHPYPTYIPAGWRRGGLLSVALSLGLPPPDVIRHRASMEPGLSSTGTRLTTVALRPRSGHPANWPGNNIRICGNVFKCGVVPVWWPGPAAIAPAPAYLKSPGLKIRAPGCNYGWTERPWPPQRLHSSCRHVERFALRQAAPWPVDPSASSQRDRQ